MIKISLGFIDLLIVTHTAVGGTEVLELTDKH